VRNVYARDLSVLVLIALMPMSVFAADLSPGIALVDAEKWNEAKAFFAKHNDGKDAEVLYYLGRIAVEQGEYETAEDHLEKAVAMSPDTHAYVLWLGKAYGSHGRDANMITKGLLAPKIHKAFSRAVELKPDDVDSRQDLVSFYLEAPGFLGGSFEKAREQAAEIEKLDGPAGVRAWARIATAEKKPDEAYALFKKGAETYPDDSSLAIQAASMAQQAQRWDEASELLEACVARHPDAWIAWYQFGRIAAVSEKRLERSAEGLQKFLEGAPADVELPRDAAHSRLGQVYEKLGKKDEARTEFQAALKLNPGNEDARAGLARTSG